MTVRTGSGLHVVAAKARLHAEGFVPGAPAHVSVECQAIDAHAVHAARCGACGKRRLAYRPFHAGRIYRALAACPCGWAEEF